MVREYDLSMVLLKTSLVVVVVLAVVLTIMMANALLMNLLKMMMVMMMMVVSMVTSIVTTRGLILVLTIFNEGTYFVIKKSVFHKTHIII